MLFFAFFSAVFSSVVWLIYSVMFVNTRLAESHLLEQEPEMMLILSATVVLPILVIWMVFGYFNQFLSNREMNRKQSELLTQLQKNQDYTDLVVRVMLDAEHEIKDGFVLNKFDVFIQDMNETLGEIIQRCNIASSAQLDLLWQRVRRGEKWSLGKAVLDANKNQSTFDAWVREKADRDKVFRGSLLEFCSRYQNLLQMLEKHDRDRIFLGMIESGVFGKVYSIIAPLSDGIKGLTANARERAPQSTAQEQKNNDYTSVLKLATMEEPKANETIVNVDKNDDDIEDQRADDEYVIEEKRPSFFARLNPFRSREPETALSDEDESDPFFQALHKGFNGSSSLEPPSFGNSEPALTAEPSFGSGEEIGLRVEPSAESPAPTPSFGNLQSTLDSLRAQNENNSAPATETIAAREYAAVDSIVSEPNAELSQNVSQPQTTRQEEKDEDLVYPFGGWTDENNYNG